MSKNGLRICYILLKWIGLALIVTVTVGCGGIIKMNVKSLSNPDYSIEEYKTFFVATVNKESPLEEKDLLTVIRSIMERKGYIYDPQYPDFVVTVAFLEGEMTKYKPPKTTYVPQYTPGKTTDHSGRVNVYSSDGYSYGSYSGTSTTPGTWSTKAVHTPGRTRKYNHRWINVSFYEVKQYRRARKEEVEYLWKGEVISDGRKDLYIVAPCLLEGLLEEFPSRTGKSKKIFRAKKCARK